ncbi:MAG: hypothetical protein PWR14_815 [Thermosediminibacterales bacterium]|nr:hypothetical protein [Thermosediminibacterales bacterium]
MQIILDGTDVSEEYINDNMNFVDLNEILKKIEENLKRFNKLYKEIKINGMSIDEFVNKSENIEVSILEITSTTREEIIAESIETAKDYLPKLRDGLHEVLRLFHEGKDQEAISLFISAVDGLEWFNSFLNGMQLTDLEVNSKKITDYQQMMKGLLDAWEMQDFLLVSDIIEYELIPLIEENLETIQR